MTLCFLGLVQKKPHTMPMIPPQFQTTLVPAASSMEVDHGVFEDAEEDQGVMIVHACLARY